MLDEKGHNEFQIIVNQQGLQEIKARDGKTYVVMPLFSKAAYGVESVEEIKGHGATEKISQKWPVCPYTVTVRNLSWKLQKAELHVDGQQVSHWYMNPGETRVFDGIPTNNGIQELLFSLPRLATLDEKRKNSDGGRALNRLRTSEIGTIKIVWRDSFQAGETYWGSYRKPVVTFTQANKIDAKSTGGGVASSAGAAVKGNDKAFASTTRAGRVVRMNEPVSCNLVQFHDFGQPWEARLFYRTQSYLEDIGVLKKKETVSDSTIREAKRAKRAKRRKKLARSQRGGPSHPLSIAAQDGPPPAPDDDVVVLRDGPRPVPDHDVIVL